MFKVSPSLTNRSNQTGLVSPSLTGWTALFNQFLNFSTVYMCVCVCDYLLEFKIADKKRARLPRDGAGVLTCYLLFFNVFL